MDEIELRQLAIQARQRLSELIPDEHDRRQVDSYLARALDEVPGNAKNALMEALKSHESIRRWISKDSDRIVGQLGDLTSPIGQLYVCPKNDYTVVHEYPPDEQLYCPNDGSALHRYDG